MAGVQKPASDKAKGTLYGAINADGSFGIFDSWSHVGGQRFRKVEYSPLSPASCGKLKSWAAARDAAIEWLLHECDADRRAAVQRVRDAERATEERERRDEQQRCAAAEAARAEAAARARTEREERARVQAAAAERARAEREQMAPGSQLSRL